MFNLDLFDHQIEFYQTIDAAYFSQLTKIKDGEFKDYDEFGKLIVLTNYKNFMLDGSHQTFYFGKLVSQKYYLKNQLHLKCQDFFRDGSLQSEKNYLNGKKEGSHIEWHSPNIKRFSLTYSNDKLVGKQLSWHKNGQLAGEKNYSNGTQVGKQTQSHFIVEITK